MSRILSGDRVKIRDSARHCGLYGTVLYNKQDSSYLIEFDLEIEDGHDGRSKHIVGKPNHCFWYNKEYFQIVKRITLDDTDIRCGECQQIHDKGNGIVVSNTKEWICNACIEKKYKPCGECKEIDIEYNMIHSSTDDKYYCQDCYDEKYFICIDCDVEHSVDGRFYPDDGSGSYCSDCYDEKYIHCGGCGTELIRNNGYLFDDKYYCSDCYHERFGECEECNENFPVDDLEYDDGADRYTCHSCSGGKSKHLHEYSFNPPPIFNKEKYDDELFMGVELEVQNFKRKNGKTIDQLHKFLESEGIANNFYFKKDSSVESGFEIVTMPTTLKSSRNMLKWFKVLEWLKNRDFRSEKSGHCGLHIHLNKDFFTEQDITKMRIFFVVNKDNIYKFSRRAGHNDNYCQYEETTDAMKLISAPAPGDRRNAFNYANSSQNTIEIRAFRGTLNHMKLIAALQFAHALSNFVKYHGITSFCYGEGVYRKNSWKLFVDWCKTKNEYGVLIKQLKKDNLICA